MMKNRFNGQDISGNVSRIISYWASQCPSKVALIDEDRRLSYRDLEREVTSLAAGLSSLGLAKGDAVMSVGDNEIEFVLLLLACMHLGLVIAPCSPLMGEREMEERIRMADPALFFTSRQADASLVAKQPRCRLVAIGFDAVDGLRFNDLTLQNGANVAAVDESDDTCLIVFTSGSTGQPKGVELASRSLKASVAACKSSMRCIHDDVFLMGMPLCHIFGIAAGILLPLSIGGTVVLVKKFEAQKALGDIERHKASVLLGVPTMFARLVCEYQDILSIAQRDGSASSSVPNVQSLRAGLMAGAICPGDLVQDVQDVLGCRIVVGYGSTEAGAVCMTTIEDAVSVSGKSVGRACEGVKVLVEDGKGVRRAFGTGEVVCQGPSLMNGFLGQPEETKRVLADGWLHTGDIGSIDEDGYLRILGRKDDMIIRGGYNVFPAEIDDLYRNHDDVIDCVAVGVPDEDLGARTCLAVQMKPGSRFDAREMREYAFGKIAKYKIPDFVIRFEELPRLATGKNDSVQLREVCTRITRQMKL